MKNQEERQQKFQDLEHIGSQIDSMIMSKISVEYCQIRIPEEQIIVKDPGQKALITSIMCPICLLTLPMPYYECEQCNNSFCPKCIESWWMKHQQNGQKKSCIFKCQDATFKRVKRSNTYQALLDTLQFKCTLCEFVASLSIYEKHKGKQCPQAEVQCANLNCYQVMKRKNQSFHQKTCAYRLQLCKYCKKQYAWNILPDHEEKFCHEKTIKCSFKKCGLTLKVLSYEKHVVACEFKEVVCPWCKDDYLQTDLVLHERSCQKRVINCEWCNISFKAPQFQQHKCPTAKQICKLCQMLILCSEMAEHKQNCVFDNLVSVKHQNKLLFEQNAKLHHKITQLQELIEDTISNSEGKALEVMKKFKMNERKQLEKDLMRIDYSMGSINRLKDEEYREHMKRSKLMILGHGLCIQCKLLEKKFEEMIEPLAQKRKQVIERIKQFDKYNQTSKG